MNKISYLDGARLHRAMVAGVNNVLSRQDYLNKINVLIDPTEIITTRLTKFKKINGSKIEKNDVRIIWWTWSVYPKKYQEEFIKGIYDAFNTYDEMKEYIEKTNLSTDRFASFKIKETYAA